MKRLATDGLILAVIVVAVAVTVGMLTLEPVFAGMGASEAEMAYVRQYMTIWYFGVPLVVIPIVG